MDDDDSDDDDDDDEVSMCKFSEESSTCSSRL